MNNQNQFIGFDRKIQLRWLDTTIALCQEYPDPGIISERLQKYLANDVRGVKARRNTITILLRLWVNVPDEFTDLRDAALQLAAYVNPEERRWLHWGMSLLAYPLFRDVASTAGQLGRLQGVFTQAQIQRRIYETWGQRSTLQTAVPRILRTFVDWDVLRDTDVRGKYAVVPARHTENKVLALWLLDCALQANQAEQVLLGELGRLSYIFPFDLVPFINDIRRSERFEVRREGLDLEMVASRAI